MAGQQAGHDHIEQVRCRPGPTAGYGDRVLVRTFDVQHRPARWAGRASGDQAGRQLFGQLRTRLGARRAHGGEPAFGCHRYPTAAAHGADGVALRHVAADLVERCSRSGRQGDRPLHRQGQRGRSLCLDVRPRRLGGRLREHLGHGQAVFRLDEGQELSDSQPAGLQFRGALDPRHGRRRAELRLRGLLADRYDVSYRCQPHRDPDQSVSQSHGAGHERRRPRDYGRSAPHGYRQRLRGGGRGRSRAASGNQPGHGSRALQRALHLHRGSGLGR